MPELVPRRYNDMFIIDKHWGRLLNKDNFVDALYLNDIIFMQRCVDAGVKFTQEELEYHFEKSCRYTMHGVIYYLLKLGAVCSKKHLNAFIRNVSYRKYKKSINVIKKLIKLIPVSDLNCVYMQLDMCRVLSPVKIKELFDIFIKAGAEPLLKPSIAANFSEIEDLKDYRNYREHIDLWYTNDDSRKYYFVNRTKHEFIVSLINNHYKELVEPLNINDCSVIVCEYLFADVPPTG